MSSQNDNINDKERMIYKMEYELIVMMIVIVVMIIFVIFLSYLISSSFSNSHKSLQYQSSFEDGQKKAGRYGERVAIHLIQEILNEKDVLLTNVKISFEDRETELDDVIINNRGVFIIEVKNYSGTLSGNEDDFEWIKNKETEAGIFYHKMVKNPIKQVKRQISILSQYLRENGVFIWVEGYTFLVENNSPINSSYVLNTQKDIHTAIHLGTNNKITKKTKEKIIKLLS